MASKFLNDLLKFKPEDFGKIKIRFNQPVSEKDPLHEYKKNAETINSEWLLWRKEKRFFNVGQIAICFLKLPEDMWPKDMWLLTTIKKITKELGVLNGVNYEAEELPEYKSYYGRVIIKFHKSRAQLVFYKTVYKQLEVSKILSVPFLDTISKNIK